jgi:hypothetical protein
MEDDGSLGRQLKMQQDQKTVFRKLLMTSWAFKNRTETLPGKRW